VAELLVVVDITPVYSGGGVSEGMGKGGMGMEGGGREGVSNHSAQNKRAINVEIIIQSGDIKYREVCMNEAISSCLVSEG